jgi:hypothetical protein
MALTLIASQAFDSGSSNVAGVLLASRAGMLDESTRMRYKLRLVANE